MHLDHDHDETVRMPMRTTTKTSIRIPMRSASIPTATPAAAVSTARRKN